MNALRFFRSCLKLYSSQHGPIRSAAMTYFSGLALMPFIILISSIAGKMDYIGLLQDWLFEWDIQYQLELPLDTLIPILNHLRSVNFASLGVIGSLSLFITFWFVLQNLEENINAPWKCHKKRRLIKRFGLFAPFMGILFGSTFMISIWLETMRKFSQLQVELFSVNIPRPLWAGSSVLFVLLGLLWVFLFFCYATLPRTKVLKIYSIWTSLGTSLVMTFALFLLFIIESWLFNRYSVIYGSIAILPTLGIGLYTLWWIALLGNAVNLQFHFNAGWSHELTQNGDNLFQPAHHSIIPTIDSNEDTPQEPEKTP